MHACPLGVWWGMSRRVHIQPFRGRCRPGMTERMWGHFLLDPLPHSPSGSVPTALHAVAVTGRLPPPGDPRLSSHVLGPETAFLLCSLPPTTLQRSTRVITDGSSSAAGSAGDGGIFGRFRAWSSRRHGGNHRACFINPCA